MKKSLIIGILGLAAAIATSHGAGSIFLDNYLSSTYNPIYLSAEFGGGLLPVGFTVGIYYDPTPNADIRGSIAFDQTGYADPSGLNAALVPAVGPGSTAPILSFAPGYFFASSSFLIQPNDTVPAQNSYTLMLVAYNGSSYNTSTIRSHSAAIYVQDAAPTIAFGADLGFAFPSHSSLFAVPEPTTMALAGLGLLLFRRKQV